MKEYTGPFWFKNFTDKGVEVSIVKAGLIEFCHQEFGYSIIRELSGNFSLVKVTDTSIIRIAHQTEVKQDIKKYLLEVASEPDVWITFAEGTFVDNNFVSLMNVIPLLDLSYSTADTAYLYFANGALEIKADSFRMIKYSDFEGMLWEEQIQKRDFDEHNIVFQNPSDFEVFLKNVSANDERFNSLLSIAGYLISSYKDPSDSRVPFLYDQNVDFSLQKANGGTGKSLFMKALSYMTPVLFKDGKNFNPRETFSYDDVRSHHRIMYIDDVNSNFPFSQFYSIITGDWPIKRKYRDSTIISAKLSPKIAISSNYYIMGTGGNTDNRRRVEFEFAPYYDNTRTPLSEFDRRFFDDWDKNEWDNFTIFMIKAVQKFLAEGLIEVPTINVEKNRIIGETHLDFIEFMEDAIQKSGVYDKGLLISDFKSFSPTHKHLSSNTFKKWIDLWGQYNGYGIEHRKSNGKYLIRIVMPATE